MKGKLCLGRLALAALALSGCGGRSLSSEPLPPPPGRGWVPMAVGERWTYAASWNGIPVGTAVMEATDVRELRGRRVLHVSCATRTNAFLETFHHLDDRVASDIDLETGRTLRFWKHLEEGSDREDAYVDFDHGKGTATCYTRDGTGDHEVGTMAIPPGTEDPLSVFFRIRALPLRLGEPTLMRVNSERKNYETPVQASAREVVELPKLGSFRTLLLDPVLEYEGIFPSKGQIHLWLEETSRIPVEFKVKIKIGSVTARLARVEGGKPPPTAPDHSREK